MDQYLSMLPASQEDVDAIVKAFVSFVLTQPVSPWLLANHFVFACAVHRAGLGSLKNSIHWLRSLVCCALGGMGGGLFVAVLTAKPWAMLHNNEAFAYLLVSFFLIFYSPFDLVWRLYTGMLRPFVLVIEGLFKARTVISVVAMLTANADAPDQISWPAVVVLGSLSAMGGSLFLWFEASTRHVSSHSMLSRPPTGLKIAAWSSLLYAVALHVPGFLLTPDLAQLAISVFWMLHMLVLGVWGDTNPFLPVEALFYALTPVPDVSKYQGKKKGKNTGGAGGAARPTPGPSAASSAASTPTSRRHKKKQA